MTEDRDLWALSAGEQSCTNGKNVTPVHLYSKMDELAAMGQPLVIETDDEKVLNKAAEYAAQKGYDLASPDPEQNLKIITKQNALAGEEIAEGELGPSKQKALEALAHDQQALEEFDAAIPYSDDPSMRDSERAESARRHAEIEAREEEYREMGWLPKQEPARQVEQDDPVADIAKIAEQTKALPDPIPAPAQKEPDAPDAGVRPQRPAPLSFPEKRPAEVLARRLRVPTVKDHGNRIVVTRMGMLAVTPPQRRERQDLVSAALLKARERFGDPVRVTGNKAFENAVIRAAIEQGIPLEMGSDRGEKAYALALRGEEKRLAKTMGQLSPAKERAIEKGQGRELAR